MPNLKSDVPPQLEKTLTYLKQQINSTELILNAKNTQLDRVIQDIKDRDRELRDLEVKRRKEFDKEYKTLATDTETKIYALNSEVINLQDKYASEIKKLDEIKKSNDIATESSKEYSSSLSVLVEKIEKLEGHLNQLEGLIEDATIKVKDLQTTKSVAQKELEDSKKLSAKLIASDTKKLEEFKTASDLEKKLLTTELEDLKIELRKYRQKIADTKAHEEEWIKALREDETTLEIKIKAFHEERDKFQIEKQQLARRNRVI